MLKVLFDQNISVHLRPLLPGHTIFTAAEMSWDVLTNGHLLGAAEQAGFDVIVTADKRIYGQHYNSVRKIALLVLTPNRWAVIRNNAEAILEALGRVQPGKHEVLNLLEGGVQASAKASRSRR